MDSKSQQAIGVDRNDTKNQTLADLTSVLKSIEEKITQELLVEIHKKTNELELLRVKYREIVLENPLIKDKLRVCQRECDELREQVKRLGQDKKEELDLLDKKYGEIVLENLLTRDKLKACERECDELKEQVMRLGEDLTMSCDREKRAEERYMKLMENVKKQEGSEREKYVELQRRNGDLECGKRKAEAEVQLWKTKFEKLDFQHSLFLEGKAGVENVGSNKGVEEKRLGQTKECKNEKNGGSSIATLDRCVSNFREKRIRSAAGTSTLDMAENMGEKGLGKMKECHKKIVGDGIATLNNRQTQNNVSNFHEKIIGLADGSSALDKTKEIGGKGLGKTNEHHIQENVEKVIETIDNRRTQNNVSNSHRKTIGLAGGSSTLDKTKETGEKGSGKSKECHNEKNVGSNANLDNRKTQNNVSNCHINICAMAGQSPSLDQTKEMREDVFCETKECYNEKNVGIGIATCQRIKSEVSNCHEKINGLVRGSSTDHPRSDADGVLGFAIKGDRSKAETKETDNNPLVKRKVPVTFRSAESSCKKQKNTISDFLSKTPMKRNRNKPERPCAFLMFMDEFKKQYTEKHPAIRRLTIIVKAGSDKWLSMSAAEKAPYVAKTEERMAEYHMNMQTYERSY